ncbi:MAG: VanZ family protein [Clostridia bacterium]|nr:VanZ family protein [Clostridia bacterium]
MGKTWIRMLTTGLTLGIMVLIFCFSSQPAEKSDAASGIIAEKTADVLRPDWRKMKARERKAYYDEINYVVRKCAHYTEFTLLGFSLRMCLESWLEKKRGLGPAAWAGAALYAALDESHQMLVDGRSAQIRDVMIDSGGVLTGVLLAGLTIRMIGKHIHFEQEEHA